VFEKLKTAFTTAPVLKVANPYKPFILECDCLEFELGAVLSQGCESDGELHPVAYLLRLLVSAEQSYEVFDCKELLAIIAAFKEWRQYLEDNPYRLKAIVCTDHCNLESLMTTKELTRRQARWAKILGCFDFEIVFRPGRESSKPDALSRQPDLAPPREEKLTFGQLLKPNNITSKTFSEVAEIDSFFVDKSVVCKEAEHWFQVNVVGIEDTDLPGESILTNTQLIEEIRRLTLSDPRLAEIMRSPTALLPQGVLTVDGLVYTWCGKPIFP
jgi:hypothetical protein